MYNKEIVSLILAVLSLIASIIAFLFPEASKHQGVRITVGIVFLFVAIILGAWGVSVLVLGDLLSKSIQQTTAINTPNSVTQHPADTSTSMAPTATSVLVANTPVPPTATDIPPTDTSMPTFTLIPPTNASLPAVISTDTPVPPTNTPKPTATFTPVPVKINFSVPGNIEGGTRIDISTAGFYQLGYVGNAYSPWPSDGYEGNRGWATHVQAFINRPVEWGMTSYGLIGPINFDVYLGAPDYHLAQNAAIAATRGKVASAGYLNAGDYITFVVVDERGVYSDNRGQVDLVLVLVGQ